MSERRPLTPKQQRFVQEYLCDLNATQAAIRAGYSAKTANEQGAQLLANLSVKAAVQAAMDERAARTELTADWIIEKTRKLARMCLGEEDIEITDRAGGLVKRRRFDALGASKALELLGKHKKLFTDRIEHSGKVEKTVVVRINKQLGEDKNDTTAESQNH